MDITCLSDLHGHYPQLKGGDLLIVAGDITKGDAVLEWVEFFDWLRDQPYKKKIYIGGNHDNFLTQCCSEMDPYYEWIRDLLEKNETDEDFVYLCDSGVKFERIKIWGSPWTKTFPGMNPDCKAFTVDTDEGLAEKWKKIPKDTDILITHCPPYGMMDEIEEKTKKGTRKVHVGSGSLTARIHQLELSLHVFGHVHAGYGHEVVSIPSVSHMGFANLHIVNASHVNEGYEPVNKPVRIEL